MLGLKNIYIFNFFHWYYAKREGSHLIKKEELRKNITYLKIYKTFYKYYSTYKPVYSVHLLFI